MSDPFVSAAQLEGIPSTYAGTRDGIDGVLRDRGLRRSTPDDTARSLLLGFGIFALNPVDVSCTVLAMLDVRGAAVSPAHAAVVIVVFAVVGILPIAAPVFYTLVKGTAADPLLERVRSWIAGHTSVLNAGLLVLIGAMQLQKALSAIV